MVFTMIFFKDTLNQVDGNLFCPVCQVPEPKPGAIEGAMVQNPPFIFIAKSQKCLLSACDLVHYYETVGLKITLDNIFWYPLINNFSE